MLLYDNRDEWRQLWQCFGSRCWKKKTFFIGMIVSLATAGLQYLHEEYGKDMESFKFAKVTVPHPFSLQALGGVLTIAIVFRTNLAWKRYWEGVSHLHHMYSKWADSYSQFCGFLSVTVQKTLDKNDDNSEDKVNWLRDMQEKIENDFLLLSAMACDRLCRGDQARMQRRTDIGVGWSRRVVVREDLRKGEDLTGARGMPNFRVPNYRKSAVQSDSGLEVVEIEEADVQGGWAAEYLLNKPPKGMKYDLLAASHDRANMVVNWLNHNLAYCSGELVVAPPIQSRMYQEISNGMLGFNNAVKVADVPFSFPHAQLLLCMLLLWTCFIPTYVVSLTNSMIIGPLIAFMLAAFMFALNDIAEEMETPFGDGENQICVPEFHSRFLLVIRDSTQSSMSPPTPPRAKPPDDPESSRSKANRRFFSGSQAISKETSDLHSKLLEVQAIADEVALQNMSEGGIQVEQELGVESSPRDPLPSVDQGDVTFEADVAHDEDFHHLPTLQRQASRLKLSRSLSKMTLSSVPSKQAPIQVRCYKNPMRISL